MLSLLLRLQIVVLGLVPGLRLPPASAQPAVVEQTADPEFNLELPLDFSGDHATAAMTVQFDEQETGDRLELRVEAGRLVLHRVRGGQADQLGDAIEFDLEDDDSVDVTLRRRVDKVSVVVGKRCVLSVWEDAAAGKLSVSDPQGVIDTDGLYYQPYAPPEFDDDFMRGEEESFGEWQAVIGKWENTALVDSLKFAPRAANSFAFAAHPESLALAIAGQSFWDDYHCAASVRVLERGEAGLAFRVQDESNYYAFSVEFANPEAEGRAIARLSKVVSGVPETLAKKRILLPAGQWYRLSASVVDTSIRTFVDEVPVASITNDTFAQGPIGLLASNCKTAYFDDAEVREVKGFRDDFESGAARWRTLAGTWTIVRSRQSGNSFAAKAGREVALAIAGRATWSDYRLEADFNAGRSARVGLCFYWSAPDDYWLWRWLPGRAARHEIVRVTEKGETVVDQAPLTLAANDWHHVVIRAGKDYVICSVDGGQPVEALMSKDTSGKVGLWTARGSQVAFDNIVVEFPPGYVPPRLPQTMATDAEMKEQFANPAEGWFSIEDEAHRPQAVGMNWNKGEYFDPVDVTLPLTGVTAAEGKVTLTIEGDQTAPGGGYDLVLSTHKDSPELTIELFRNSELLERATTQVTADADGCQVRFGRRGTFVVVYVDGQLLLSVRERQTASNSSVGVREETASKAGNDAQKTEE